VNITVLGIGNILLSDDGVGVHVINRLKAEYEFPEHVRLMDGGTKGLDLLPYLEECDKILIIDAANFKKDPGTIDSIEDDRIPGFLSSKLSVHQIGLPDMLFAARFMGITPPKMCLIGIQPKSMETGTMLSDVLQSRIDILIEIVLQKLKDWGVEALPKAAGRL
jgi:hydrogenase maturation protease